MTERPIEGMVGATKGTADPHRSLGLRLVLVPTKRRSQAQGNNLIRGKRIRAVDETLLNRSGLCFRSHIRGSRRPVSGKVAPIA